MKKLLLALLFVPILFIGCKEDEDKELDSRLVGTKWQTEDTVYQIIFGGNPYQVYEFINTTEVERYTISNGSVVDVDGTYKYTLNYPNLSIKIDDSTTYEYTFSNTREFIRSGTDGYGMYEKYIKQ